MCAIALQNGTAEHQIANEAAATASVNPTDDTQIVLNFDSDTVPGNTILTDSVASRGTIDAIIDPLTFNPDLDNLAQGTRYLILNDIHQHLKNDSSDSNMNAWQNADGTVVQASTNDIITWNGSNWEITFDAGSNDERADSSVAQTPVYITNTYTGVQYKFTNDAGAWLKSYEGE